MPIKYLELPVYHHRKQIINAVRDYQVIVVESATGSGKTTQIPLILHDAGYIASGVIGVTQPRRIAAMSVSEFIGRQLGEDASLVGYTMRFADTTTPETRIKIMTDGILLQELKTDRLLSRYSVIMVDEAHERSLNIDFILGRLQKEQQEAVFTPTPPGKTKVVCATNIAETSITIDGIRTVIDSGLHKINVYDQATYTSSLVTRGISKASADQRKGRAGCMASGVCYRLYSADSYENRKPFTEEEIKHSDIAEVGLRMSDLGIFRYGEFPFITPPGMDALKSAEDTLLTLGAITPDHRLTPVGEMMVRFPVLPRHGRILAESVMRYPDVIAPVTTVVASLSAKSPFVTPPNHEDEARAKHKALQDRSNGDFGTFLKLFTLYKAVAPEKRREWCRANYMDYETMEEIQHIRGQLLDMLGHMGIPITEKYDKEHFYLCIMAGLRQFICRYDGYHAWSSVTADGIYIHPGSAVFSVSSGYIVAGDISSTSKLWARNVSEISKKLINTFDPNLLGKLGTARSDSYYGGG